MKFFKTGDEKGMAPAQLIAKLLTEKGDDIDFKLESARRQLNELGPPSNAAKSSNHNADRDNPQSEAVVISARITSLKKVQNEIKAAIEKFSTGNLTWICECGEPIPIERVLAVPQTDKCIKCAKLADEESKKIAKGRRVKKIRKLCFYPL